jgi:predicted nucleotidyltransferase
MSAHIAFISSIPAAGRGQVGSESGLGYNGVMASKLKLDQEAVATFCRRHHVRRLALFGSVLRDDFTPASDVDVLVEFEPGHAPGLAFFSMEAELSALFGRKVDLNTPGFLSRYFRDQVLAEAETQYVAA